MKAIISVVGANKVGILAKVATCCMNMQADIQEVTQNIMDNMFTMTMLVAIDSESFKLFSQKLNELGQKEQLKIHVMQEDIFTSMHQI